MLPKHQRQFSTTIGCQSEHEISNGQCLSHATALVRAVATTLKDLIVLQRNRSTSDAAMAHDNW